MLNPDLNTPEDITDFLENLILHLSLEGCYGETSDIINDFMKSRVVASPPPVDIRDKNFDYEPAPYMVTVDVLCKTPCVVEVHYKGQYATNK